MTFRYSIQRGISSIGVDIQRQIGTLCVVCRIENKTNPCLPYVMEYILVIWTLLSYNYGFLAEPFLVVWQQQSFKSRPYVIVLIFYVKNSIHYGLHTSSF